MPHTTIEHSFAIDSKKLSELCLVVNQNIPKNEGNFDITQCKTRSIFSKDFVISDGTSKDDFIHVTIKIMEGRSAEIRKNLAINILQIIGDFLSKNKLSPNPISLSLDVREMDKEIYQRTVITN